MHRECGLPRLWLGRITSSSRGYSLPETIWSTCRTWAIWGCCSPPPYSVRLPVDCCPEPFSCEGRTDEHASVHAVFLRRRGRNGQSAFSAFPVEKRQIPSEN